MGMEKLNTGNGGKQEHQAKREGPKTYNTRDSLVVTDPTTNPAVSGLTRGERTGSRVLQILWSYVLERCHILSYICSVGTRLIG